MENQHRQIKGYKELNQETIDLMNKVKEKGKEFGDLIEKLSINNNIDQRWLTIGATQVQQGLMAVTRAITKPDFF